MSAVLRWLRADLRAHRGRTALTVLVTAVTVVCLVLAAALLQNAANPWQRLFTQSHGSHIWLHTRSAAPADALARLDGVEAVAGPYTTASCTLSRGAEKVSLELQAVGPALPQVSRPLLRAGNWLDRSAGGGAVVLESTAARAARVEVGDAVTVQGPTGVTRTLRVLGVADSADQGPYPTWSPGLGWVQPATLRQLAPGPGSTGQAIGLRLRDPGATDFTAQQAVTALGSDRIVRVSTWQQARSAWDLDNRLLGRMLGVFGLAALLAGALAAAAAAGERVLGRRRDIAVLKSLGFTPLQTVGAFLLEHLLLAVAGLLLGAAAASLVGPRLPGQVGAVVALWQSHPGHARILAATGACTVLSVALATALPAWRAGRVPPVPAAGAVQAAGGRMSRLTRVALLLRLPPALVLGTRDAFHRPLRAAFTVARLAVPVAAITAAMGTWATLDGFAEHPQRVGLAAALSVRTSGMPEAEVERLIRGVPGVREAFPVTEEDALVPGQTRTITLRAVGSTARPYPYTLAAGRPIRDVSEAVAGQGLLDIMHIRIGQWVRVTAAGEPHILHIVGRSIEPDHNGEMLSVQTEALAGVPGARTPPPDYVSVVLAPGADRDRVREELASLAGGRLDVRTTLNPAQRLGAVRVAAAGLIAVLALIALAELLTITGRGLRDHAQDLGVLRATGLTPRQVAAVIATSTGLLALIAAVLGCALGTVLSVRLVDIEGASSGIGAGIARAPSPGGVLLLVAAAVVTAACVSVVPCLRAVRAPVTAALRAV